MQLRLFLIVPLCLLSVIAACGQRTAREDIAANPYLSGSNYLNYDNAFGHDSLTPPPAGYEPFYLSHYGRHGSRWLLDDNDYARPLRILRQAAHLGKLTATGDSVLRLLEAFCPTTKGRLGDLTRVGELQHKGIGTRMARHFPELFLAPNVEIDARSTVVQRCILSMAAECEALAALNPTADIHNDVSESLQCYLNAPRVGLVRQMGGRGYDVRDHYKHLYTHPERLMRLLFNDPAYVRDSINAGSLMRRLFDVATNMQSHFTARPSDVAKYSNGSDGGLLLPPDTLLRLFTDEELYDQWRIRNVDWYIGYASSPLTGSVMQWSQKALLENIIASADTVTRPQAALRFGHEICVMPLAALLELGSCGAKVGNLDTLDRVWRNYEIFPMACNIQLVFYRPKGSGAAVNSDSILVKALLNERETALPVPPVSGPYCRWTALRAYYKEKIARFEAEDKAASFGDEQTPRRQ